MTTVLAQSADHTLIGRECQQILAHHAKSFRWASWFLPASMRVDASIVYAFCRLVDDAVDEASSPQSGRRNLQAIKDRLQSSEPGDDLIGAYREVASRRGFGLDPAWGLIAGAESDLGMVRVRDDAELLTYCYRVAGTVGLMMCGVLGVSSSQARAHAVQLGIAMQLTNICRDVREDLALGRIYLPRTRLQASGAADALVPDLLLPGATNRTQAVSRAVLGLLADSERVYELAAEGFRYIPTRPRLAIMVAARLYRAIGRLLRQREGDALAGRVVVSSFHKALLMLATLAAWLAGVLLPQRRRLLLGSDAQATSTPRLGGSSSPLWPARHAWSGSLEGDHPGTEPRSS